MRILLVEDEEKLAKILVRGLREEGHVVDHATHGQDARARMSTLNYDVIVLDWMLADDDGLSVLAALRREGNNTPVLMVTARASTKEKVLGLRSGADDYLAKPFDFEELLARIDALHRRSAGSALERAVGDLVLDARKRCLSVRKDRIGTEAPDEVSLTAREFALAVHLFDHVDEVCTRASLLTSVWGHGFDGDPNILDVYVGYLRTKLARFDKSIYVVPMIRAVRGVGLQLRIEEDTSR